MPTNSASASTRLVPIDQPILKPLVIPLAMVVIDEFLEGPSKVALTERHHAIEALVFDRPYELFSVVLRIGRLKWRLHDIDPGIAQQTSDIPAPFPITITDQHVMIAQQVVGSSQRATDLTHEEIIRMRRGPIIWTRREARSITNTV
jgi:hypothetical protein